MEIVEYIAKIIIYSALFYFGWEHGKTCGENKLYKEINSEFRKNYKELVEEFNKLNDSYQELLEKIGNKNNGNKGQ